jgi:hypothetical protein
MVQFFLGFAGLLTAFSAPAVAGTLEGLIQSGVLPKNPVQPLSSVPLINRVADGDYVTTVNLAMRPVYARSPIHIHANGGLACVLQGEETLYIENKLRSESSLLIATTCLQARACLLITQATL